MAKYIGSKGEVRIPERIGTTSRQESDQQVNEWLRALTWGVSADELVGRNLENEFAELYIFDDKGKLIPAIGVEEKLNDRMVGKRLLEHAQGGQLFIRALGENGLRQVTTDANYNIGLSKEIGTDTKFPKVEIPEVPKRPFFLKFWLPFLFRNEIDDYKAKKAEYDEAVKRDRWTRNFDASENKAILSEAAGKEKERYDYEERFEKKQELRQKEIDAEVERERLESAKQIQEQIVVSGSKQAAENIREQQKDHEVSSAMCKGLLALGHPNMAEGTGYRSYEQLLQDLDKGGSVNPQIQNGAQNLRLQGMADPAAIPAAIANVLQLNNQYISRYTPDQPQFHVIARVNEEIFSLLEGTYAKCKADLGKLGIRQEDMDLARGVVEVDRMYQKGLNDKVRGLNNLANRRPVGVECVAGAMTGEVIRAMAGANKQKDANAFYAKLGESKRNTPVSEAGETYDDMKNKLWINRDFQTFMRGKAGKDALELLQSPAQLRKEGLRMAAGEMGKQLGMPEKPVAMEPIRQGGPEKQNTAPVVQ